MISKLLQLKKYSNPDIVAHNAHQLGLNPVYISTRKDKKYMISDGHKIIHFGQMGYEDYTKHKDEKRRDNFRNRNRRWAHQPKYTAGWLSYNLLW